MKTLRKILLLASLVIFSTSFGQDYPQFSQHVGLQGIINPAYNGSRESYSALLVSRSSWANAINTHAFNAHAPLPVENFGAGLLVMQDNAGLYSNLHISAALSYTVDVSYDLKLAMGLQGGLVREQVDNAFNNSGDANDVVLNDDFGKNNNRLSAGLGFYLYSSRYFIGLAMPDVLPEGTDVSGSFYNTIPLMLYGGYVFDVDDDIKIKPTVFTKMTSETPLVFELGVNAFYKELLNIGVATRTYPFSALVFSAEVQVVDDVFVCYSYDLSLNGASGVKSGAHEISLRFDVPAKRIFTRPARSMRYF